MLDRKFVLENADLVTRNCADRGADADVTRFVALEQERRAKQADVERLNREANEVSKGIGKAKDEAQREAKKAAGRQLREAVTVAEQELTSLTAESDTLLRRIPNLTHPEAPIGPGDTANREVAKGRTTPRTFTFKPADHVTVAERLGMLDLEGGAKVAGHGF